jgi:hypothetical protein
MSFSGVGVLASARMSSGLKRSAIFPEFFFME